MNYQFALPATEALVLRGETVDRLLALRDGTASNLFLYIQRHEGQISDSAAQKDLALSQSQLDAALHTLRAAGLLSSGGVVPLTSDERPQYQPGEVSRAAEKNDGFRMVVEDTQRRLGRVLSSNDLLTLFGLYDWIGLPPGVILMLVTHCIAESQARHGKGKLPTLRQIEREAIYWESQGIVTEERAEAFIERRETLRRFRGQVLRILHAGEQSLSKTSEEMIRQWGGWGMSQDAVELAQDKMVTACGGLRWNYIHAILKSWHEQGLHTRAEIEAKDKKPADLRGGSADAAPGDGGDADRRRMEALLERLEAKGESRGQGE